MTHTKLGAQYSCVDASTPHYKWSVGILGYLEEGFAPQAYHSPVSCKTLGISDSASGIEHNLATIGQKQSVRLAIGSLQKHHLVTVANRLFGWRLNVSLSFGLIYVVNTCHNGLNRFLMSATKHH